MAQATPDTPSVNVRRAKPYQARRRAATKLKRWPCRQCGCQMGYPDLAPGKRNPGSRQLVCSECAPDLRFKMLVLRYGVDKAMYEAMYFEQGGKCAIEPCQREARSVDHCHRTGSVRGLLCQGCNAAIGIIEGPAWLDDARGYLAS